MKNKTTPHLVSWILLVLSLVLFGDTTICSAEQTQDQTTLRDVKQEAEDLLQELEKYSADQKNAAVQKTKAAIEALDEKIAALETRIDTKWDKMSKVTRKKARAGMRMIRAKRIQAAEAFGSMQSSSADAWEHMKKGVSDAYQELYDAWQKSEAEFNAGT